MASNNFDGNVLIDDVVGAAAAPGGYFGFQRAQGASVATGPRIYALTNSPQNVLTAPAGSIALQTNGVAWINTTGVNTGWTQLGNLSGAVTLTAIDSTATAAFVWSVADNAAAAVSFDATGDTGILIISSLNAGPSVQTNDAFRVNDAATLQFGTPGTDVVITADGTDAVITATGDVVVGDDVDVQWGTAKRYAETFVSASNELRLEGVAVSAVAATAASSSYRLRSGARTASDAAVSTGSGAIAFTSGATDTTNAGGTGGPSGALTLTSGAATSTLGTSGSTGAISLISGNSDDANSGNIVLTTGTAGGTRGVLDINAATIDTSTQATATTIIDNSATSFVIRQSTNNYLTIDTTDAAEAITLGNGTTNPSLTFNSAGFSVFDGIDMGNRIVLQERFTLLPVLVGSTAYTNNENFKIAAGTNSANAGLTFPAGGGVQIATAGAMNDQEILIPQTAYACQWDDLTWSSAAAITFKMNVRLIDVTNVKFYLGVTGSPTALDDGTANDQFVVRLDTGDGVTSGVNWVLVTSATGVDTKTNTGIAATASTNYRIVLSVAASTRQVSCFINGALVNTPASHVLTAATDEGKPFIGIQALSGAARAIQCYSVACSKVQL